MASDLLALLDTLDGLHGAATEGEWEPMRNGLYQDCGIRTRDGTPIPMSAGGPWDAEGIKAPNVRAITALHNAYPHLAQALRTALTPTTDGEREAWEALADFDRSNAVPPCCLCGKALTLQSADAFCRTWACEGGDWRKGHWSAFDDTPERTMADQHYSRSQFEQRPSGMAEHLRHVLTLLTAERAKAADAARERAAIVARVQAVVDTLTSNDTYNVGRRDALTWLIRELSPKVTP